MRGLGPLLAPLLLRPLRRDRLRFALTVSGIAVGVATVAAIRLANSSVLSSFSRTVDLVAGKASLTVLADGPGIPEGTLERLAWVRSQGVSLVPALSVTAALGTPDGEVVELLGVDPLSDGSARDYRFASGPRALADAFAVFEPGAVLVSETFAARHGLSRGSPLPLLAGGARRSLHVAGILRAEGVARAASGSLLVADLATVQEVAGRAGWLDRIDLVLPDGAPGAFRDRLAEEVRASLPPTLTVGRPERRNETVDRMVRSFRVNLTALGLIALLVGTYFVYNTVSISVLRRRADIGTVRGLGASARAVFAVFLLEGAALGTLGSLLGVALGTLLARGALAAVGGTATDFYLAAPPPAFRADAGVLLFSFVAGVVASTLSALAPAAEAARVAPAATMRHGSVEAARRRTTRPLALLGLVLLALAAAATRPGPVAGLPVFGFASVFLVVAGASLLAPLAVTAVARRADRPALALLGVEARIARANLTGSLSRTSVAVAALAMGVAMMVAVAVMVGSFRGTVEQWVSQTLKADLFAAPESGRAGRSLGRIPQDALDLLERIPGVAEVDAFLSFEATRDGIPYTVGCGRLEAIARRGNLPMADGRDPRAVAAEALARGEALVSEPFATRFGLGRGDVVRLPAPGGEVPVTIAGVYTDYSNDRGTVTVDRALFRRLFGLDGASSAAIYLSPGVDPEEGRRRVLAALHGRFAIAVRTNATLRAAALALFDRTFAITYALDAIAVAVAVLGVFNTLVALVLERQREIGLLRVLGASAARVERAVRLEAAAIAALGTVLGLAQGGAMAWVLVHVINVQSFGWTIRMEVPGRFLAFSLALVLAATLLSALHPARLAAGTDPAAVLKEE